MTDATRPLFSSSSSSPSIRKILVPVDGSNASLKGLEYAAHLAKLEASDTELIVVHILEDVKQGGAIGLQAKYGNVRLVEGFKRARREAALKWLRQIEETAKKKGIRLKTEVLDGDSKVKIIIDYAKKNSVDLIVIGSTGVTGFKRLLLGSVANAVVSNAPCPVMVVRG
ncbi:MAG: universal stress protein [Thermoproteota archaeon]|nr:universal stress protein [Thermoproteota archaeon]